MKPSLQRIEDFYMARGYSGSALRKALAGDSEYRKLVEKRRRKLTKLFKITPHEREKYLLSLDDDWKILKLCKMLYKLKLTQRDRRLVKLVETQLKHEWRKPLLVELNKLIKKYS